VFGTPKERMFMPITGKDKTSLEILTALKNGMKVKEIPANFPVSLDQVKRLSRYHNYLEEAKHHLSNQSIVKLKELGLKSLALSSLFKEKDWEGLTDILAILNERTKRDEIPLFIQALQEKRKRLSNIQDEVTRQTEVLNERQIELEKMEMETNELIKQIEQQNEFLKQYPRNVQEFLIKHLGYAKFILKLNLDSKTEYKLVLARRIDSAWQKNLKKKGIIQYDPFHYLWFILDLDRFVEEYEKRINRKNPLPTEWNYEKEKNRNSKYIIPENAEYRLPTGLSVDLLSNLTDIKQRKLQLEKEREEIQKKIKQLKKKSPQSFIEAVEVSNLLSTHEIKRHGELQDKALKWLYSKDYIVASEIILPNGKRADVIGYNQDGHIIIVEVKVSKSDYMRDEKWRTYLNYCDEYYFLLDFEDDKVIADLRNEGTGLLTELKQTLAVTLLDIKTHRATERNMVIYSIGKALTKKYVFGY